MGPTYYRRVGRLRSKCTRRTEQFSDVCKAEDDNEAIWIEAIEFKYIGIR